jgi:hypothetical protein
VGLKVLAIKGYRDDMRRKKGFTPEYILFDDGQTYIMLEDQDYHAYHDCDSWARRIEVRRDETQWGIFNEDEKHYPDADLDLSY